MPTALSTTPTLRAIAAAPESDRLRPRDAWLLFFGTVLLGLYVWSSLEGYNLADTVEQVSIASRITRVGTLQATRETVRPPALPLFYTVFVYLDHWITGPRDQRLAFYLARGFQVLLSGYFVVASAQLAARLGGARAGLAAGLLVALNPVFLRYAVDPLPGLAAGTLFALGLRRLVQPGTLRESLKGGLLIGGATIVAYKVIPLAGALFFLVLARDRWKQRAGWIGLGTGILVVFGVGYVADYYVYGAWGASLMNYLVRNIFYTGVPLLVKLGLTDVAVWIGDRVGEFYGMQGSSDAGAIERRVERTEAFTWYFDNGLEFLVWPAALLVVTGVLRAIRRPRWSTTLVFLTVLAYALLLSSKHSKEYRLALPALPLIASLGGIGWVALAGTTSGTLRAKAAGLLFVICGVLGVQEFHEAKPRAHGAYWPAVEWMEAEIEAEGYPSAKFAVAEPFNVFFRTPATLAHQLLRKKLRSWPKETRSSFTDAGATEEWGPLAYILTTETTLDERAGLRVALDREYELEAAFYDHGYHMEALGPTYVFRSRRSGGGDARMFETLTGMGQFGWRQERRFGEPIRFRRARKGRPEELVLLGLELFEMPGSGLIAARFSWTTTTTLSSDFSIFLRIVAEDGVTVVNGRLPVSFSGTLPQEWKAGEVHVDTRLSKGKLEILRRHGGARQVRVAIEARQRREGPPEWLIPVQPEPEQEAGAEEEPRRVWGTEAFLEPHWYEGGKKP